jgi:autotransporter-associated beta strand protein
MNKRALKGNATGPCGILPPALWRSLLPVVFLLCIQTIQAGSASWSTTPASGDWNTAANWVPMTIPDGSADTATFVPSNLTGVSLSANTEVNGIVFNADASEFIITTNPMFTLTVSGVGITRNGLIPTFVNNADLSGRGEISFFNNATAGGRFVTYYNNGTPSAQMTGGRTSFFGTSTAGSASFMNKGNAVGGGLGGRTFFNDFSTTGQGDFWNRGGVSEQGGGGTFFVGSSSADNGNFVNDGGTGFFAGGFVQFLENSTAGNATFANSGTVEGEDAGGTTLFAENSSAGNAILSANGPGAGAGGEIYFLDDSTGGTALVRVDGHGKLDLSFHNAPGVTIGSLEGTGNVFLGARNLTLDGSNLSPVFSGVIQDGGLNGGVGGSLTKIGPGRLALSGANTYTGPTTINAGKLSVDGSITSAVTVNNGGTLGGIGTVSGTVIVNAEATLSGGDATTASGSLTVGDNLTLNSNSVIELGLGASGAHSTLNRTGGTWTFASNQAFAFFNVGPSPGTYDNVITGLAGDPGGTAAWTITTPGFAGSFTYDGAGNIDLAITAVPSPTPASQAINLSTRMRVQAGDNAGIGGFIITGTAPKHLLLRAIGPSITMSGLLADPVLELHDPGAFGTITNDNWMDDPVQAAAILATGLAPTNNLESAIDATLNPGAYTAVIRGKNNTSGIGLIEVYDLSHAAPAKLANISTRAFVGTGDDIVIAGFILGNNSGNDRIVVRGLGPSLTALGVPNASANPALQLHDANGAQLVRNENWQDDPAQAAELTAAGLAPTNNLEAAIAATLPPGSYTAFLFGTGNGLVEVYDLGSP